VIVLIYPPKADLVQPCAAAKGGGPSRLQSARLVAAVAELGSFAAVVIADTSIVLRAGPDQYGPPHQGLRFAFGCDQTFLPDLLRSLRQAARELGRTA
jgi:hypothetical protein